MGTPYRIPLRELIARIPFQKLGLGAIPDIIAREAGSFILDNLGITGIEASWDDERVVYRGTANVMAVGEDTLKLEWGQGWSLVALGGAEGWPFSLTAWRKNATNAANDPLVKQGDVETDRFLLEMHLPTVSLRPDPKRFKPARLVKEPFAHLEPWEDGPPVQINVPDITLRIDSEKGIGLDSFGVAARGEDVGQPGFVFDLRVEPSCFLLGDSVGLALGPMILDLTESRTPGAVRDKPGYDDAWKGFYVGEATLYLRDPLPAFPLSRVGVKDLIWGFDGSGLSLKLLTELRSRESQSTPSPLKVTLTLLDDDRVLVTSTGQTPDPESPILSAPVTVAAQVKAEGGIGEYTYEWGPLPEGVSAEDDSLDLPELDPIVINTAGDHEITVEVEDAEGNEETATAILRVRTDVVGANRIAVRLKGRGTGEAGSMNDTPHHSAFLSGRGSFTVEFTASAEGGSPPQAGYTYRWSIDGEEVTDDEGEPIGGATFTHTFQARAAAYLVAVEAGDQPSMIDGLKARASMTVEVLEAPAAGQPDFRIDFRDDWLPAAGEAFLEVRLAGGANPHVKLVGVRRVSFDPAAERLLSAENSVPHTAGITGAGALYKLPNVALGNAYRVELEWQPRRPEQRPQGLFADKRVLFTIDKDEPDEDPRFAAQNEAVLRAVADALQANAWITRLRIVGLTCDIAGDEYNQRLSERRAENTRAALIERGVAAGRLETVARGEDEIHEQQGDAIDEEVRVRYRTCRFEIVEEAQAPQPAPPLRRVAWLIVAPRRGPMESWPGDPPDPGASSGFANDRFREARLELEIYRSELTRLAITCKLNLFGMITPGEPSAENPKDGWVEAVFQLGHDPVADTWAWSAAFKSDPGDSDGLCSWNGNAARFMAPLLFLPPVVAISPLEWWQAAGIATAISTALVATDKLKVERVTFNGARVAVSREQNPRRAAIFHLGVDYGIDFNVDLDLAVFKMKTTKPIRVRYDDVGFGYNWGTHQPEFHYNPRTGFHVDIQDPGVFELNATLARLFNVARFRMGTRNPFWFETELTLGVETGVFSIDRLKIRQEFSEPDASGNLQLGFPQITPAGVKLAIPGVVEGSGRLIIEDRENAKAFGGSLRLRVVPLRLEVGGGFRFEEKDGTTAVLAAVETEFATGIPLFTSGLSIYGFSGLFAMHFAPSRGAQESYLDWFKRPAPGVTDIAKWVASKGSWTFGLGTVLGTSFDGGRLFNAKGVVLVEIPGPRVVFGMLAKLFESRPGLSGAEQGNLIAVMTLDLGAMTFQVDVEFSFKESSIIELQAPAQLFVDLRSPSNFHLYLGKYEGPRVTLKVFGFLNAQGYLMIAGHDLRLGQVTLGGPAVAFGFRCGFDWWIVKASLEMDAGIGFRPLVVYGMLKGRATVDLYIVSASVFIELRALAGLSVLEIHGRFGVSVSICWFFSIGIDVSFDIGTGGVSVPPPDPPVTRLAFRNRFGGAEAFATLAAPEHGGLATLGVPVPVDVRPVLNLQFEASLAQGADLSFDVLDLGAGARDVQVSPELRYQFSLRKLTLRPVQADGSLGEPLRHRPAAYGLDVQPPAAPGEVRPPPRARDIGLLTWEPHLFAGSVPLDAELSQSITSPFALPCAPPPPPRRACYDFEAQQPGSYGPWTLRSPASQDPLRVDAGTYSPLWETMADYGVVARSPSTIVDGVRAPYPDLARVRLWRCLRLGGAADVIPPSPSSVSWTPAQALAALLAWFLGDPDARPTVIEVAPAVELCLTLAVTSSVAGAGGVAVFKDAGGETLATAPLAGIGATRLAQVKDVTVYRVCCHSTPEKPIRRVELFAASWASSAPTASPRRDAVYLLDVCALPVAEAERFADDQRRRQEAAQQLRALLVDGMSPEAQLLEPGTQYELEVSVDWKGFGMRGDVGGGTHSFRFRFTTDAAPIASLTPYVAATWPPDGDEAHYTAASFGVQLETNTVAQMLAQHGERLALRLQGADRHDPYESLATTDIPLADAYEVIALSDPAAVEGCILGGQGGPVQGTITRVSRGMIELKLHPNVWYEAMLIAEPADGSAPSPARAPLHRWRLKTSRYRDLAEHVAAYRAGAGDVFLPVSLAEITAGGALAALPPAGQSPRADDALVDRIIYERMQLGAFEPPAAPRALRLWSREQGGPRFVGLLLDGPEPFLREVEMRDPDAPREVRRRRYGVRVEAARVVAEGGAIQPVDARILTGARGARCLIWMPDAPAGRVELDVKLRRPDLGEGPAVTLEIHRAAAPLVLTEGDN